MNVFVLCTGRCGSTTFIQACGHIRNYSAGHETRSGLVGTSRLEYRQDHIEADNRLSWFLGRLDVTYGDRACYVHLRRNPEATVQSFLRRYDSGIMHAYHSAILMGLSKTADPVAVCRDYVETVTQNIVQFLRNKSRVCVVNLETAAEDFRPFWTLIGAIGDVQAALAEWRVRYNAS